MDEDLKPFEKLGGITEDQFNSSRSHGVHYQIINHRLYREDECMFPFRSVNSWILINALFCQVLCIRLCFKEI